MNKSESIKNLADALSKAQAEMPSVPMNSTNPFLKNKFADLGAVITTAKPVLQKYGLSYSQMPLYDGNKIGVTTIIMHSSGEWIESSVALEVSQEKGKSDAQVAGSIITYLRRYSLASAFGMHADEDTDGSAPKSAAPKTEKKELSEAEKKNYMLNTWSKLVDRAKSVNMTLPAMDAGWNIEKMKAHYKEQKTFVEQAEEQAKAG